MAVRRIEFLEQQFAKTMDSIRIIQEHEGLPKTVVPNTRPENGGRDLVAVLDRLDELEYEYGWIQNSLMEIQEYSGLEQGFFPRLPYRWEGPPPATFRYRGRKYYDHRPAVITPTGRAGTTSLILETTEEDGDWEVVTNELGDDRGRRIHIGKLSLRIKLKESSSPKFHKGQGILRTSGKIFNATLATGGQTSTTTAAAGPKPTTTAAARPMTPIPAAADPPATTLAVSITPVAALPAAASPETVSLVADPPPVDLLAADLVAVGPAVSDLSASQTVMSLPRTPS